MINILAIDIEPYITAYGKGGKAMTAAVVAHLQTSYPEKAEEYKLVYRKALKFIEK
jgi:hypothetical protein